MLQKQSLRTEKIGIVISIICALHCLIMPMALFYIGQQSMNQHFHGAFDIVILVLAAIFMGFTVLQSLKKPYFNKIILLLILGGFSFLISFFVPTPFNHYLFVAGSLFWLVGHIINYRSNHNSSATNV